MYVFEATNDLVSEH